MLTQIENEREIFAQKSNLNRILSTLSIININIFESSRRKVKNIKSYNDCLFIDDVVCSSKINKLSLYDLSISK